MYGDVVKGFYGWGGSDNYHYVQLFFVAPGLERGSLVKVGWVQV